jgi:creatinine amidohydrolase/Fe(II)-dependent formamide hydrolase-like protein
MLVNLFSDVYRTFVEHSFKKIMAANGHRLGNNSAIEIAARSVGKEY